MISRTKTENILTLTLNCINVALYLLVIAAVIYKCLSVDFSQIMIGIYGGIIAAALVVNEIKASELSMLYFRFLSIYSGRGIIFIFFGCIVLDTSVLNIIAGTLCLVFGCMYIILSFVTSFPPPNAMTINWQNWKDFSAEGLDLIRPSDSPPSSTESKAASYLIQHPPRINDMARKEACNVMTVNEEEQSQNQPSLRKYTLPRLRSWLHVSQVVFTLLSVCMVAPIVAVQLAYKGSSAPGPNYTLFVIAFTVLIPACLAFFPWMYESKNRMKRCGKFFLKPRTNVVFTSFCSLLWLTAAIAITTYALAPDTCTLDANQKADGYNSAWTAQCNCAKVAIAFVWLTSLLWIITLLMALLVFYKQKQLVQQNLQHVAQTKEQGTVEVVVASDPTPTADPAVVEPYHEQQPAPPAVVEPYYGQQSAPPAVVEPYYGQQSAPPAVVEPYYEQQSAQQHYSFLPQHYYAANPQPSPPYLHPPLAAMPDPQHYRQQHGVV